MSILPPNSTRLERTLEQAVMPEVSLQDFPVRDLWNPDICPVSLLPWLAWALSVDTWEDSWPESVKRNVVRASIGVHRRKGTLGALREALEAIWSDVTIREWFEYAGSPYRFRIDMVGDAQLDEYTSDIIQRIIRQTNTTKPVRSILENLLVTLKVSGPFAYTGGAVASTHHATFQVGPWMWSPALITDDVPGWFYPGDPAAVSHVGGAVYQIGDELTDGLFMVQTNPAKQPTIGVRTLNGRNVLDGNGSALSAYNFPIPDGNISVFAVGIVDSVTHRSQGLFAMNSSGPDFKLVAGSYTQFNGKIQLAHNPDVFFTGGPFTGPHIFNTEFNWDISRTTGRVDGIDRGSVDYLVKLLPSQQFTILADKAEVYPIDGAIGEIIAVCDLTSETRFRIEGYLAWKWGLVAQLPVDHAYKTQPPPV